MKRLLYPVAIAVGVCVPLVAGIPARAATGYAGHWTATLSETCKNSKANAKVCSYVLGSVVAIGKAGTTLSETSSGTYTVAANGRYTDNATARITVTDPHATLQGCPSASKLDAVRFNGTCSLRASGNGHVIVKGGQPLFYDDFLTIYYQGKRLGSLKGADANTGLPTPARVGIYGPAWAAREAGGSSAPTGFSFKGVIARSNG
jgi:hypothetical protein